eukprot:2069910-Karenia_brevis.AAC.1
MASKHCSEAGVPSLIPLLSNRNVFCNDLTTCVLTRSGHLKSFAALKTSLIAVPFERCPMFLPIAALAALGNFE